MMDNLKATNPTPFACDLTAITPSQRKQHEQTSREVFAAVEQVIEQSNGYAFRLPVDSTVLMKAAEFVTNERLCCPFFGFTLEIEPANAALWLQLTGTDEVKPFIRAEVGTLLNDTIARAAGFR